MAQTRSWRERLGPDGPAIIACAVICVWTVVMIDIHGDLTASRLYFAATVLALLAAASAWLSIRWRRAEEAERRRRRQPFQIS
jgi:hypothetical protein